MYRSIAMIATLLLTVSASAESALQFHIKLTDGRSALLANPRFADLKLTEEQLGDAAKDRVFLLDRTSGTSWTWLMLSWLESKPDAEHGLTRKGTARAGLGADIGLTPFDEQSVKLRCLRDECVVRTSRADRKDATVRLMNGQSTNVPLDSDVQVRFSSR